MNTEMIMSLVRHLLTFGGGFVVAKGWVDAASWETIAAALVSLFGVGWGIWQKKPTAVEPPK